MSRRLERLGAGQLVPYGGDRVVEVDAELAERFRPGDRLIVVQDTGDLLHIPQEVAVLTTGSVDRAEQAFGGLAECGDEAITAFFVEFAQRLASDEVRTHVMAANAADVDSARTRGRALGRLKITDVMWQGMIDGVRAWSQTAESFAQESATIEHDRWTVTSVSSPLGIVGFVFEGRPNVFADAVGVVRTRNTVVMRIGSDALRTAESIMADALGPALDSAGLPGGTVELISATEHAAGWSLFSDRRLALAVARGSGSAVRQLGAVARQSGVPVSLHGTGGAWMLVGPGFDHRWLVASIRNSLDRKVCNTLNVICIERAALEGALDAVAEALDLLGEPAPLVHVAKAHQAAVAAGGRLVVDPTLGIDIEQLGSEWEWDERPELSLVVAEDLDAAIDLFNRWSPRFIASVITGDPDARSRAFERLDAPFLGDGFTRWVDGQYALGVPELGLSNWEGGRLLGRGAVLTGQSVHTVRLIASIDDPDLRR